MSAYETLDKLLENGNGYLTAADTANAGISRTYLYEYVKRNNLERVAAGVYKSADTWLDELYIIHLRNKNVIFSHETALYFHHLSDGEPMEINITVPRGYNAAHLRKQDCRIYTVRNDWFDLGKTELETNFGNKAFVYNKERTICDIIRYKETMEIQSFQTALKEYMHSRDKNLHNLIKYAKIMGIDEKIRLYTEVML